VLGLWALDPELRGVGINMPTSERLALSKSGRARWEKLAAHIAAGHRLRCRLGFADELSGAPLSEIPIEAEALIDPKRFAVTDARGRARNEDVASALREVAQRLDKARGRAGRQDPDGALEVWQGLLRGRWSLVDWFDTDGRRYIVVVPNAPDCGDPRGLTEREHQVAMLSARGESAKVIGDELGVSRQRVSQLLRQVMRKLGVRTHAQLVLKLATFRERNT
jgi:DNA-binding CsgD family transcriptional regulator